MLRDMSNYLFLPILVLCGLLVACDATDEQITPDLGATLLGNPDPSLNEFLLVTVDE